MKEFKGTKGEWGFDSFSRSVGIVSRDPDQSYGMVCEEFAHLEFIDGKTEKANGELIAAAPELLEVLQEFLSYEDPYKERDFREVEKSVNKAKEIIKRALGE